MTELKPCPFCGSSDVGLLDPDDQFHCRVCGAASGCPEDESRESKVDRWNTRVSPWRSLKDDPPEPPTEVTNHAILIRNLGRELVDNRYHQLVPYNDTDNGGVLRWFEVHLDWVLEDYLDRGFSEWMEVPE